MATSPGTQGRASTTTTLRGRLDSISMSSAGESDEMARLLQQIGSENSALPKSSVGPSLVHLLNLALLALALVLYLRVLHHPL